MEGVRKEREEVQELYDSLPSIACQALNNCSDTEADMYDYTSLSPLDYEVPDQSTVVNPDNYPAERESLGSPTSLHPPPSLLPKKLVTETEESKNNKDKQTMCKFYTTLTHSHIPSVYCTPSPCTPDQATRNSARKTSIETCNLESSVASTPLTAALQMEEDKDDVPAKSRRCSKMKAVALAFLLMAIAVGMIAIVISIIAVFVTKDIDTSSNEAMEQPITSRNNTNNTINEEIIELYRELERLKNRMRGTIDITSLYQTCDLDTSKTRCSTKLVSNDQLSCNSQGLPMDKEGYLTMGRTCYAEAGNTDYVVTTSLISSDNGTSVHCQCTLTKGGGTFTVNINTNQQEMECALKILRCPLQHTLNVTLNN